MEKSPLSSIGRKPQQPQLGTIVTLILTLTTVGLTGCVQTISTKELQTALATAANQPVPIPPTADVKCDGPPLPAYTNSPAEALAEARSFGVLSVGAIDVCDLRRALAVDAINLHNQGVAKVVNELRPLKWWEHIVGRH